jgi:cobalt/nickel transport protein
MTLWQRNLLLLIVAVALAVLPLLLLRDVEWRGADDRGTEAILELNAEYEPWVDHLFDPGALGIERYLFGLQALLGAGVTFAAIGWFVGRRAVVSGTDLKLPLAVAAVAVVLCGLLFLPDPEAAELQDSISALQGICLGYLAYFVGFRVARRASRGLTAPQQPAPLSGG